MKPSLVSLIVVATIAIFAGSFGSALFFAHTELREFAASERQHQAQEGLAQLEESVRHWESRIVSRVKDLGTVPELIQGVMQPGFRIREMRRYLDHTNWDGRPVQFTVLDFEGGELYQRLGEPAVVFPHSGVVAEILDGLRASFVLAHRTGAAAWLSVGAPIGRTGFPEGVIIATVPIGALTDQLPSIRSGGLELRLGDAVLFRSGAAQVDSAVSFSDSPLSLHYGPDLSRLDAALSGFETTILVTFLAMFLGSLGLLHASLRSFLATPIRQLVAAISRIDPAKPTPLRLRRQPFRETDALVRTFSALLARLAESQRWLDGANRNLERRVERRTAELAARNQELERFAYVASHDLQEPLRKISAFSEILCEEHAAELSDEGVRILGIVRDGAVRMGELIRDLLDFSQIGRTKSEPTMVNLSETVSVVLEDLAQRANESGARIEVVEPLPSVPGHRRYLQQLFQNLLSNAIKFSGEQPPDIRIEARSTAEEVTIRVRDRGIGIEQKYFDRVFGMFERLHSKSSYSGTGIGLAICKRVVEVHHGRIWVETTLGGGATFAFVIPAVRESLDEGEA
ncbi:MAG: ATP-binding protein [Myxococcota bacterium]